MSALRDSLLRLRRSAFEVVGNSRYSCPALHGLDRKLVEHLGPGRGIFIEAGANDGLEQSNTYYLERFLGWSGLLIEPVPALAEQCRRNRPGSVVAQAALVGPGFPAPTITMDVAGLMSTVRGAFGDEASRRRHHGRGLEVQHIDGQQPVDVPARTISSLIDEHLPDSEVNLLILDVEGYEVEALKGLDLGRHAPRYACIECRDRAAIESILAPHLRPEAVLHETSGYADVLFVRNDVQT